MRAGTTSTRIVSVVVLSIFCCLVQQGCSGPPAQQPSQQTYDLVIAGGRVIDPETNLDAVRNVGVTNGTIALVTEQSLSGKQTIDAKGLIVAPGFIDPHSHGVEQADGEDGPPNVGFTRPAGIPTAGDWRQ